VSLERSSLCSCVHNKNSLFVTLVTKGEGTGRPASLIETCELDYVNPRAYSSIFADTPRGRLASEAHRRTNIMELDAPNRHPDRRQVPNGAAAALATFIASPSKRSRLVRYRYRL
jgi:hypothetical protein